MHDKNVYVAEKDNAKQVKRFKKRKAYEMKRTNNICETCVFVRNTNSIFSCLNGCKCGKQNKLLVFSK